MKIASFGDSFIFGSELRDLPDKFLPGYNLYETSNLTYPALIAKKLSLEYQCFAYPGAGNQRILNDVLSCIHQNKNQILYIINWTWINRFDYYNINSEHNFDIWLTVRPSLDNPVKDDFYYKNFHSEMLDKTLSLGHIYQAVCALEQNSCQYVMTYIDNLIFDSQWHATDNILFLQNQIKDKLVNYNGKNFLDWSADNGFKFGKYGHPLEQAHEKAAEFWLPKVCTLLNIATKEN
jgi:hypothetical protein